MKKLLLTACFFCVFSYAHAQSCEEREAQMLGVMGSLSAGFLYNTYGLLGSIADGFTHEAYDPATTTDLVTAQQKLADNMMGLLEKNLAAKAFKDEKDKAFIQSCIDIIKGLRKQADCLLNMVNTNNQKQRNAYEEQRKKNWKDLSKLMGLPE